MLDENIIKGILILIMGIMWYLLFKHNKRYSNSIKYKLGVI